MYNIANYVLYTVLQEDQRYKKMPLVELQPDVRFISNVHHLQEESSNCKIRIRTYLATYLSCTCKYFYMRTTTCVLIRTVILRDQWCNYVNNKYWLLYCISYSSINSLILRISAPFILTNQT